MRLFALGGLLGLTLVAILTWPPLASTGFAAGELPRDQVVATPAQPEPLDLSAGNVNRKQIEDSAEADNQSDPRLQDWPYDEELIAAARANFNERIARGRATRSENVRSKGLGTMQLDVTKPSWHIIDGALRYTDADFEGLTEIEKYAAGLMAREVLMDAETIGPEGNRPANPFTPEEKSAYFDRVRKDPLEHNPEVVLGAAGAEGWRDWPGFADDFRLLRRETLEVVAAARWEYEVCFQEALGAAWDTGLRGVYGVERDVTIVAPQALEARFEMDNAYLEFWNRLDRLVERHRSQALNGDR